MYDSVSAILRVLWGIRTKVNGQKIDSQIVDGQKVDEMGEKFMGDKRSIFLRSNDFFFTWYL